MRRDASRQMERKSMMMSRTVRTSSLAALLMIGLSSLLSGAGAPLGGARAVAAGVQERPAAGVEVRLTAAVAVGHAPEVGRTAAVAVQHAPEVKIDNFSFTPAVVTVPVGATVTWVNHDDIPHTVVSPDKVFKSKVLDTDDKFSYTFAKAGRYPYFCSIHPKMTGEVVVQ
jgi:plastocyanin